MGLCLVVLWLILGVVLVCSFDFGLGVVLWVGVG